MPHLRRSVLQISITEAVGPDPDEDTAALLTCPGIGAPREAYTALTVNGTLALGAWGEDSGGEVVLPGDFFGPNLITGGEDGDYGVRAWSITAEPGYVPGILQVAYYLIANGDNSAPDTVYEYTLDTGAWGTGPLPISSGASSTYRQCRVRFFPSSLSDAI